MTNIINLDEVQPQAMFSFKGEQYSLRPMTSKLFLDWNKLRREGDRISRHEKILEKNSEAEGITDDQALSFEEQLAVLQEERMDVQTRMMVLLLDDMQPDVAEELSDVQCNKIMSTMTRIMKQSMKELKDEVGETEPGESEKP